MIVDDTTGGGVVTGSEGFPCVWLGMGVSVVAVEIAVPGPVVASVGIVTMVEVGGSTTVVGAVVGSVAFCSGSPTTLVTTETISLRIEVIGFFAVDGAGVVVGSAGVVEETIPVGAIVMPVGLVLVSVGATDTMVLLVVAVVSVVAVVVAVGTVELPGLLSSSGAFDVGMGRGRWLGGALISDSGAFDGLVLGATLTAASGVGVALLTSEDDGSVAFSAFLAGVGVGGTKIVL
jgi:hypothetical protein